LPTHIMAPITPFRPCGLFLLFGAAALARATRQIAAHEASFYEDQIMKAAAAGNPAVQFDNGWFMKHCDLSEFQEDQVFHRPEFRYSTNPTLDAARWKLGTKCAENGDGREPEIHQDITTDGDCAKTCWQKAQTLRGTVVCCEYHEDKSQCEVRVGWQALQESEYGKNMLNMKNWPIFGRNLKRARLLYAPDNTAVKTDDDSDAASESEQIQLAEEGREHVRKLVEQVNHLSIDGILDHLLSFYVCMRYVPDEEFVELAKYELDKVAVDHATPALGRNVTREEIYEEYRQAHLFPLRCSNSIYVQKSDEIDKLTLALNTSTSKLNEAYRFTVNVTKKAMRSLQEMDEELRLNLSDADRHDSIYMEDMRWGIKHQMPWSTFLRPSKQYTHHASKPKNLFMLCFGPRVASYPHKREGGQHVLADMNMAGCNGFWDLQDITEHMSRIRKLFAPEMCFEYKLRKDLKLKFMETFVSMNQEFEQAMAGKYTQTIGELDPTRSKRLEHFFERTAVHDYTDEMNEMKAAGKYEDFAKLMAKAHSKWVICGAHDSLSEDAFGVEDNFFRNPKSYEKWIGTMAEENAPECKTLDRHNCPIRLDVKLQDIYRALKRNAYPFLVSEYGVREEAETEEGIQLVNATKHGTCLLRKSPLNMRRVFAEAGKEKAREEFFKATKDDTVVILKDIEHLNTQLQVDKKSDRILETTDRYPIRERLEEKARRESGNSTLPSGIDYEDVMSVFSQTYKDTVEEFAQWFVFSDRIKEDQNRPEHKVDYIISCPCSKSDFDVTEYFQDIGSQGMSEYYNR